MYSVSMNALKNKNKEVEWKNILENSFVSSSLCALSQASSWDRKPVKASLVSLENNIARFIENIFPSQHLIATFFCLAKISDKPNSGNLFCEPELSEELFKLYYS